MFQSWLILSLLTGTFFGIQSILLKYLSKEIEHPTILKYLFLTAGIFLLPFALHFPSSLQLPNFLAAFSVSLILNTVAYFLLLKAITSYPISIVMPFVGLTPLFLTLTSYLILGETIGKIQLIGILLIVVGGFILQIPPSEKRKKQDSFLRRYLNSGEKGIAYMILVAFIWSITASVEKIAVQSSSPSFYGASIHLALGFSFLGMDIWKRKKRSVIEDSRAIRSRTKILLVSLGVISAALAIFQLTAIKLAFVTYVITFKRAGVLVSTLYAFLFFHERNYLKAIVGTLFILGGSAIITLF